MSYKLVIDIPAGKSYNLRLGVVHPETKMRQLEVKFLHCLNIIDFVIRYYQVPERAW